VYLAANSHWEPVTVELPSLREGANWHWFADSHAPAPGDVAEPGHEPPVDGQSVVVAERSVVVLVMHKNR
jgi:pullulanase/glycogen debranching enzyme